MHPADFTRAQRKEMERENSRWPAALREIPRSEWPRQPPGVIAVWRSRAFLVQVYDESGGMIRLSVCRTTIAAGRWVDGITWDDLQRLKRECGYGDRDALELFPADRDVVNVANLRHLWLPAQPVPFAWRKP